MSRLLSVIGVRLAEGRCGSTLLMGLLGTSPKIAFDRRYPAEYRFLSYFLRASEMITEPFDEDRHVGVTPFFFGDAPVWGPVPFRSDLIDVSSLGRPIAQAMWRAFGEEVRRARPEARYYAEKLAAPIDTILEIGIPLRVIDLVRDPRDMLASIRAFTGRGIDGFGRASHTEADYLHVFIDRVRTGLEAMHATPPDVERVVVRYEDLVGDLEAVADRLARWLDVDLDHAQVIDRTGDEQAHMTSPSVERSIGRWQTDLESGEADQIVAALGALLAPFGYSL